MHASVEQLLNLRDDRVVDAGVKRHVEHCDGCRAELGKLIDMARRINALGDLEPPKDAWDTVVARLKSGAKLAPAEPGRRSRWLSLGAAAAVLAAAVLVVPGLKEGSDDAPAAATDARPGSSHKEVLTLAERSQNLEQLLVALGEQPHVVRARTADTIATLEDRLALVDYQISYANAGLLPVDRSEALWRERVDLMNSLVQVRYAEVQRTAY